MNSKLEKTIKQIQHHIENGGANVDLTAATVLCSELLDSLPNMKDEDQIKISCFLLGDQISTLFDEKTKEYVQEINSQLTNDKEHNVNEITLTITFK